MPVRALGSSGESANLSTNDTDTIPSFLPNLCISSPNHTPQLRPHSQLYSPPFRPGTPGAVFPKRTHWRPFLSAGVCRPERPLSATVPVIVTTIPPTRPLRMRLQNLRAISASLLDASP